MQQVFYCPNCHAQVAYGQPYCTNCNVALYWPTDQTQGQYQSSQEQYQGSQGQYSGQQWNQQQWGQQGYQPQPPPRQKKGEKGSDLWAQIKKNRRIITKVSIPAGIVLLVIIIITAFGGEITKWFTAPTIGLFEVKPTMIIAGEQATIQWDIKGATSSVSISPGIGNVPASGTKTVSPGSTTIYTLAASNLGGSARSTATLTVTGPPPTIDNFSFNPDTISSGQSATLSWGVSNATSVSINPEIGNVEPSGTREVSPHETTAYTLTVSNDVGNSTRSATLTVYMTSAPIISIFSANPSTVGSGKQATLTWEVIGATSININQGVGGVASKGSIQVSPTATTTYTLTADNAYSTAKKSVTVTVDTSTVTPTTTAVITNAPPVINEFSIEPSTIILGENATLRWNVSGARSVTISPGIGTVPSSGYALLVPGATTTYTITAINSFGSKTASAILTANKISDGTAPPVISSFTATPNTISSGGTSTLTWNIHGATVITIDQGIGIPASPFSQTVSPAETTAYTLTAINSAGSENRTVTVTVNP